MSPRLSSSISPELPIPRVIIPAASPTRPGWNEPHWNQTQIATAPSFTFERSAGATPL